MNQMKNDSTVDIDDLVFQEEVNDDELYSKKDVSDIIYEDDGVRKRRTRFLIILAIILIILSILSAVMGFIFLDKDLKERDKEVIVKKYDLFVTHSNSFYGGKIRSFANYSSSNKAYSYDFTVGNNNPVSLGYSIELVNPDYGNDGVDMSLINYRLLKNNEVVGEGTLDNLMNNELYKTDIMKNSSDEFRVQLWSSSLDKNLKFSFQINVKV